MTCKHEINDNYTLSDDEYAVAWSEDHGYNLILPDQDDDDAVPPEAMRLMACALLISSSSSRSTAGWPQ